MHRLPKGMVVGKCEHSSTYAVELGASNSRDGQHIGRIRSKMVCFSVTLSDHTFAHTELQQWMVTAKEGCPEDTDTAHLRRNLTITLNEQ